MRFKAIWSFNNGASETLEYSDEGAARHDVAILSSRYAREYGTCHTQLFDGDQLLLDLTETYYG